MKPPSRRNLITSILVTSLASACSSSSGTLPQKSATMAALPAAKAAAELFVSTGRQNLIQIYNANAPHQLIGQITDGVSGPNGEAVDAAGNLYVANVNNATVVVYPPGATKPSVKYKKHLTNPLTPAVGNDGTLYVSNFNPDGSGEVLEYPPGQLKPNFTIPLPGGAVGLAVDAKNNVYVTEYGSTGRIFKFKPHSKQGKDLGISLGFAGRLILDEKGNIIVCDQGASAVDVFPPGATQPSKQIKGPFVDPFALALDKGERRLFVADGAGDSVYVYSYPKLRPITTISRSATSYGIAIDPPAPLH
ncbi:MAG: hypothetical protein JO351_01155 [Candidatus Eremiobacteraeota bacterium]|nr:hypothetical protein [Candidatus Eremiobacteraeota bacterium]MBV9055228.1 hypothetical protein [Candidatus Eremiobacteraeota bacterium]